MIQDPHDELPGFGTDTPIVAIEHRKLKESVQRGRVTMPDGSQVILCEMAPGKEVAVCEPDQVPRFGIGRLMRQPDGRYAFILTHWAKHVRLTDSISEELGLSGCGAKTIRRLVWAGFVAGSQPSPGTIMVDLGSLADHIERTREPGYWTEERKAVYRETIGGPLG